MTAWAPPQVANYARAAGFRDGALVLATAVALAASAGDDHAHVSIAGVQGAEFYGLWLVKAALVSDVRPDQLYDPQTAARAAWRLSAPNGDSWEWSEVWRAGTWRQQIEAARLAVAGEVAPGSGFGPMPVTDLAGAVRRLQVEATDAFRQLSVMSRWFRH